MAFQTKALKDYNRNSNWQYQIGLNFIPVLFELLNELDSSSPSSICIVDYGSSEGYNSMSILQSALAQFRLHSSTPIQIIHTDLPENNWTALFTTINNSSNSYKHLPNIYCSAVGQSFYHQLVPSNSVHLGYSTYAFHYLSQIPKRTGSPSLLFPEAASQLILDLKQNLSHRLNELVNKGLLMFSAPAKSEDGSYPIGDLMFRVLKNCVLKEIISESDLLNFFWPTYPFDEAQIRQVLDSFEGKIEVKLLEIKKSVCPFYTEFINGGELEDYRIKLSGMLGTILRNAFLRTLTGSDDQKEAVYERVKRELEQSINNDEVSMSYYTVIIQKL